MVVLRLIVFGAVEAVAPVEAVEAFRGWLFIVLTEDIRSAKHAGPVAVVYICRKDEGSADTQMCDWE